VTTSVKYVSTGLHADDGFADEDETALAVLARVVAVGH